MTVPAASGEPPALRNALKVEAERHGTALGAWRWPRRLAAVRQASRPILFKSQRM